MMGHPLLPGIGGYERKVAVLFARSNSIYKQLAGCDVFDVERDARTFCGGRPVIAHPPCRAWGRLRSMAKPREDEKALALFAVHSVRRCGGVLEHPASSTLWQAVGLPPAGRRDEFGGWTLGIHQADLGHRAQKATWLYIVGVEPREMPELPLELAYPSMTVELMGRAERERTPLDLAIWLLKVAQAVKRSGEKTGTPASNT